MIKRVLMRRFSMSALFFSLSIIGCTKPQADTSLVKTQEQLIARGKTVYAVACSSCHNADPTKEGAIGPIVAGASLIVSPIL